MTTYGLTPAGFIPKTADVIEAEITADIKSIPGLEEIQTDAGSGWGNLIAILVEREALLWLLLLLIWQSAFRDYATGLSLDNTVALIGNSRREERHSTVTLTLFNRTSTSPVSVTADNQARQGSTGVVWELLEDAEIPALTDLYTGLNLGNITWQSGTTVRTVVPSDTDLSIVAIGDKITLSSCTNASNDGTYTLSAVNNAAHWVEYANANRENADDDETSSPGVGTITDTETSVSVPAQSYTPGAFEATPNTIQQIATPLSGWDAVTNPLEAVPGRAQEKDPELRRRAAGETVSAKGGTLEAVKAALLALPGVSYVAALENDTDEVVNGLKKHSMEFTIVGGADQAVVNCIGSTKGGGIGTNGDQVGSWVNSTGDPEPIYYKRVTERHPYFEARLAVIPHDADNPLSYPLNGDDLVKAAIEATTWTHGEDLLNYKVFGAVATAGIPGILTIEIYQSLSASPSATTNITIPATEVVNPTLDRIAVTIL